MFRNETCDLELRTLQSGADAHQLLWLPALGCGEEQRLFHCNNCMELLPAERLRVEANRGTHSWKGQARWEANTDFLEMLLCPPCVMLWRHWTRHHPNITESGRSRGRSEESWNVSILDLA